jgi:hypothetical protein
MITALRRRRAREVLDARRPDTGVGTTPPEPRPAVLYASELLVAGAAVALGLLAWAGLALAHIGRYSLPAALGVAVSGCGVILAIAWRARGRPRLGVDPAGLAMVAGLALVAGLLFFPGFPYGVGDKDPGLYVAHGIAIARTGSYALTDPTLDPARVPSVTLYLPNSRFPGVWVNDVAAQRVVPQFYHLWPALLASGFRLGGFTGLANVAPFAALLAVLAVALLVRRAFGLVAGSLAGLLLATNMLEVWQAKYQTTEVFTQLLIGAALLGVVIAIRTGWRPAAGVGGLLLGLSYLARPDGLLLVLLAVGAGCVLLALGRFDARAGWFAAGMAVTLPHGLLQAYWLARTYTLANDLPSLSELAFLVAVPVVVAILVRMLLPRLGTRLTALMEDPRVQRWCGVAITAAVGLVIVIGLLRPRLFGASYGTYNGRLVRTYAEQTMIRLSWFFTLPGLALMWAGVGVLALRRHLGVGAASPGAAAAVHPRPQELQPDDVVGPPFRPGRAPRHGDADGDRPDGRAALDGAAALAGAAGGRGGGRLPAGGVPRPVPAAARPSRDGGVVRDHPAGGADGGRPPGRVPVGADRVPGCPHAVRLAGLAPGGPDQRHAPQPARPGRIRAVVRPRVPRPAGVRRHAGRSAAEWLRRPGVRPGGPRRRSAAHLGGERRRAALLPQATGGRLLRLAGGRHVGCDVSRSAKPDRRAARRPRRRRRPDSQARGSVPSWPPRCWSRRRCCSRRCGGSSACRCGMTSSGVPTTSR